MRLDESPRRARSCKKGRGWLARASCPSCSEPLRFLIEVGRTQCVLSLLSSARLLEEVADLHDEAGGARSALVVEGTVDVTPASEACGIVSVATEAHVAGANVGAYPTERGFDDDEAPFPPPKGQVDLFR